MGVVPKGYAQVVVRPGDRHIDHPYENPVGRLIKSLDYSLGGHRWPGVDNFLWLFDSGAQKIPPSTIGQLVVLDALSRLIRLEDALWRYNRERALPGDGEELRLTILMQGIQRILGKNAFWKREIHRGGLSKTDVTLLDPNFEKTLALTMPRIRKLDPGGGIDTVVGQGADERRKHEIWNTIGFVYDGLQAQLETSGSKFAPYVEQLRALLDDPSLLVTKDYERILPSAVVGLLENQYRRTLLLLDRLQAVVNQFSWNGSLASDDKGLGSNPFLPKIKTALETALGESLFRWLIDPKWNPKPKDVTLAHAQNVLDRLTQKVLTVRPTSLEIKNGGEGTQIGLPKRRLHSGTNIGDNKHASSKRKTTVGHAR